VGRSGVACIIAPSDKTLKFGVTFTQMGQFSSNMAQNDAREECFNLSFFAKYMFLLGRTPYEEKKIPRVCHDSVDGVWLNDAWTRVTSLSLVFSLSLSLSLSLQEPMKANSRNWGIYEAFF